MSISAHPHDQFFKRSMQEVAVARDFFQQHLPQTLCPLLDLKTLRLESTSFVKKGGRSQFSDVLYSVQLNKRERGYLFVLAEHQSTPDPMMALRMLEYVVNILKRSVEQGKKKLPAVFSLLFYHGAKKPYPYSTDLFDLFEYPELARSHLFQPFHLVDVTQIPDAAIVKHGASASLQLLQKHIRARDINVALQRLIEHGHLHKIAVNNCHYFAYLIEYTLRVGVSPNKQTIIDGFCSVYPEQRSDIMTIAEELHQEGKQEGKQEGLQEGRDHERLHIAQKLLRKQGDIYWVAQITELSVDTLKKLKAAT